MTITLNEVVSLTSARTNFSKMIAEVECGGQKIITKNGEPAVALINLKQLAHYHRLEAANLRLTLLHEAKIGLADVQAGRRGDAKTLLIALINRRAQEKSAA